MTLEEWKNKGLHVPVFNNEMFVIDTVSDKKTLLILHGYACSSYDYYKILPELSKRFRVIIPDLICFGSTTKYIDKYISVIEQTDSIIELLKVLKVEDLVIFGHDYGASIASEIIARKNSFLLNLQIDQLVLSNFFLPKKYFIEDDVNEVSVKSFSKNTTSMLSTFSIFKKTKKKSLFNEDDISDEDFENMWNLYMCNEGIDIIDFIANYDGERKLFWNRWINALESTQIKTKILWGKEDIFTTNEIVESLATNIPNNEVHFIENCGYFPMLERPMEVSNLITVQ